MGLGLGVAIVLVAAVAWAVVRAGETTESPPPVAQPTAAAPSPAGPSSAGGYDSSCGLSGGSIQMPTAPPTDLGWVDSPGGWRTPVSESAGPGARPKNGPWTCFARTPSGAAIAGFVLQQRLGMVDDYEAAVRSTTVPGVGQKALLSQGPPAVDPSDTKGFVVESYSADEAIISYYLVAGGDNYTCSTEVVWRTGDWKLRLQSDGSTTSGCITSAPARFVPWGDE